MVPLKDRGTPSSRPVARIRLSGLDTDTQQVPSKDFDLYSFLSQHQGSRRASHKGGRCST